MPANCCHRSFDGHSRDGADIDTGDGFARDDHLVAVFDDNAGMETGDVQGGLETLRPESLLDGVLL